MIYRLAALVPIKLAWRRCIFYPASRPLISWSKCWEAKSSIAATWKHKEIPFGGAVHVASTSVGLTPFVTKRPNQCLYRQGKEAKVNRSAGTNSAAEWSQLHGKWRFVSNPKRAMYEFVAPDPAPLQILKPFWILIVLIQASDLVGCRPARI